MSIIVETVELESGRFVFENTIMQVAFNGKAGNDRAVMMVGTTPEGHLVAWIENSMGKFSINEVSSNQEENAVWYAHRKLIRDGAAFLSSVCRYQTLPDWLFENVEKFWI